MVEHTKTPWRAGSPHPSNACVYIVDSEGSEIATLYGGSDPDARDENGNYVAQPIRDAHAAFIVQACNAFDDLVAVLKDARRTLVACHDLFSRRDRTDKTRADVITSQINDIDAALSRAGAA